MTRPPAWWKAGHFWREEEWDKASDAPVGPYLKVTVEATERSHNGYCSELETTETGRTYCRKCVWTTSEMEFEAESVEIEETTYKMVGAIPLKDAYGHSWNFLYGPFDPGWRCASGGSGFCGVRPSVVFLSMERIG
jgi:hypothetical protein